MFLHCEYCDSSEIFNEDLPRKNESFNNFTNRQITDEDYERDVVNIWKVFRMKKKINFSLYLKRDALLLDDVYQTFRKESANYLWDAIKKIASVI